MFSVHIEALEAVRGVRVCDSAENLECFSFDFFFFARDGRDDVIEDVEGGHIRVLCAGDGLRGGDYGCFDGAEGAFEGEEGDD